MISEAVTNRIIADIEEGRRLHRLSDLDLIHECLQKEVSDDPVVRELMNRLDPNWLEKV